MPEEENVSVETQVSQEVAQPAETENANQAQSKTAEDVRKRNDVEYNWAEARRKMQELERKAKEQDEIISRLQKPEPLPQDDELDKLADDDIVTKAQAKKLANKMAREQIPRAPQTKAKTK